MSGIAPAISPPADGFPKVDAPTESQAVRPRLDAQADEALGPNFLVRGAFYLSIFSVPFNHLYLPGTGERVGVTRLVQALIVAAVLSQPRVCLRLVPTALLWFLAYGALRIFSGLWLTPELSASWWPSTVEFLEFLPWVWVTFNVLQFPDARRGGLWALGLGCSLCALFHVAGIGVTQVSDDGLDNRSSVFGLNANALAAAYSTAMIALLGLWMLQPRTVIQRLLPFPLIALIGIGLAKTGSRSAMFTLVMGVSVLVFLGKAFGSRLSRAAALAMLGAMVALILWEIPTVLERFDEINPQNVGFHNPRARMAPVLWEMFLRSPIYGSGPDHYQPELTRRAMPYLIKQEKLIVSHNLVLLLLVETGIIGFVLFAAGASMALAAAWRARLRPCGSVPLAMLLPFIICGVTMSNPMYQPVFWFAVAYGLAGTA